MPRKLPEEFEGKELAQLAIAGSPAEARKIESVLDSAGVDYTFEITSFERTGLNIFRSKPLEGVLFLVQSGQLGFCRDLLLRNGLSHLLVEEE